MAKRLSLSDHRPLTEQERRFAEEYFIDLRPELAAIRAGYSPEVAKTAPEMLREPQIAAEVLRVKEARSLRTGVTMDRIVMEYARIAFADPMDAYDVVPATEDADGNPVAASLVPRPLDQMPEDTRRAIESIETLPGGGSRIKFASKLKALEMLTPHIEALNPNHHKKKTRTQAELLRDMHEVLTLASKRAKALPSRATMQTTAANGDKTTVMIEIDGDEEQDVTP